MMEPWQLVSRFGSAGRGVRIGLCALPNCVQGFHDALSFFWHGPASRISRRPRVAVRDSHLQLLPVWGGRLEYSNVTTGNRFAL